MFCKRYRPEELLANADCLARFLLENQHVTGVALTGSLARLEPKIHDIDLVVLHEGALRDGSSSEPSADAEDNYDDAFPLDTAFVIPERKLVSNLRWAAAGIPVNYIFVNEKALWDCKYVQSLEERERYQDFFTRVFCDIPLVLLRPRQRRGLLQERIELRDTIWLGENFSGVGRMYEGMVVRHKCGNPKCQPRETWAECRKRIKRRKLHWWHPFLSLVGR